MRLVRDENFDGAGEVGGRQRVGELCLHIFSERSHFSESIEI